ncbi:enolase C-terminal domain-like protein [Mycobacterium spongiae]|uniref:enolase C-terminal domain-like protein n=1 Tax=Mycobacterium spongiae TaxID=886343 RepID=UPI001BA799EA|nr:enolase C-terminal domain-like protein [Mycobacterium spongiae]
MDLFAREDGVSVEVLLGLGDPRRTYAYTGVLGDESPERFTALLEMHLAAGFSDYKVKLGGDLAADRAKLDLLHRRCTATGRTPRVRLDANNLWRERPLDAGPYLTELRAKFFAFEEPVAPGDVATLARLAVELDRDVILDESVCRIADLEHYTEFSRPPIVNVKVSKAGGIMRAREIVRAAAGRGLGVVVGAHVGETSVLTRAGMLLAQAAGDALVGHEGGYGAHLLTHEPAAPCLTLGRGGLIDLSHARAVRRPGQKRTASGGAWSAGWGLTLAERL